MKVTSSPIVRRVRKSESSKSLLASGNMRKSVSMDSVPSASSASLAIVLTDFSEDNTAEISQQQEQIFAEPPANIEGNGNNGNLSASYGTLPLSQSFSRGKNISRSLVPKMRKFFEKSRSCDPELPQLKIRLQREPNSRTGRDSFLPADGTESARSSFVLLAPGEDGAATASSFSGSTITLEEGSEGRSEELRARQLKNNKAGFVNKCVGKVRSLMGSRSEERGQSEC